MKFLRSIFHCKPVWKRLAKMFVERVAAKEKFLNRPYLNCKSIAGMGYSSSTGGTGRIVNEPPIWKRDRPP
ncbi:MAG: hypothetical protein N2560_06745 [Ignavibacteria bacterium]|nr:hypothetical protein [Ignavibacteria bacterium]